MRKVIIFAALAICVLATITPATASSDASGLKRQNHLAPVSAPSHHQAKGAATKTKAAVDGAATATLNSKAVAHPVVHHHRSSKSSKSSKNKVSGSSAKSKLRRTQHRRSQKTHSMHKHKRSGSAKRSANHSHGGRGKKH